MNSFARCQHLFDMAAKPIDVHSNFLSHPSPLFLFCRKYNRLICLQQRLSPANFNELCSVFLSSEAKEIFGTGRKTGRIEVGTEAAKGLAKIQCLRCSMGCGGIKKFAVKDSTCKSRQK